MSHIKDRLTDYYDQMNKLAEQYEMITAKDVLDMIEQLIDDFEEEKTDKEKRCWNSDKRKIYDYIKTEINPYGKPFKGTTYELGLKIMDYIENMSDENGWISVSERLPEDDTTVLVSCKTRNGTTFVRCGYYVCGSWHLNCEGVKAWLPLPEPYKED